MKKYRLAKISMMSYLVDMTAEALLEENIRYDRGGKPVEVVIPYGEFIDFLESYGLDLSEEEKADILEAGAEIKAGRFENFVSAEEAKRQLGI